MGPFSAQGNCNGVTEWANEIRGVTTDNIEWAQSWVIVTMFQDGPMKFMESLPITLNGPKAGWANDAHGESIPMKLHGPKAGEAAAGRNSQLGREIAKGLPSETQRVIVTMFQDGLMTFMESLPITLNGPKAGWANDAHGESIPMKLHGPKAGEAAAGRNSQLGREIAKGLPSETQRVIVTMFQDGPMTFMESLPITLNGPKAGWANDAHGESIPMKLHGPKAGEAAAGRNSQLGRELAKGLPSETHSWAHNSFADDLKWAHSPLRVIVTMFQDGPMTFMESLPITLNGPKAGEAAARRSSQLGRELAKGLPNETHSWAHNSFADDLKWAHSLLRGNCNNVLGWANDAHGESIPMKLHGPKAGEAAAGRNSQLGRELAKGLPSETHSWAHNSFADDLKWAHSPLRVIVTMFQDGPMTFMESLPITLNGPKAGEAAARRSSQLGRELAKGLPSETHSWAHNSFADDLKWAHSLLRGNCNDVLGWANDAHGESIPMKLHGPKAGEAAAGRNSQLGRELAKGLPSETHSWAHNSFADDLKWAHSLLRGNCNDVSGWANDAHGESIPMKLHGPKAGWANDAHGESIPMKLHGPKAGEAAAGRNSQLGREIAKGLPSETHSWAHHSFADDLKWAHSLLRGNCNDVLGWANDAHGESIPMKLHGPKAGEAAAGPNSQLGRELAKGLPSETHRTGQWNPWRVTTDEVAWAQSCLTEEELTLHHYAALVRQDLEACSACASESRDDMIWNTKLEAHLRQAMNYFEKAAREGRTPRVHPLLLSLSAAWNASETSPDIQSISENDPRVMGDPHYVSPSCDGQDWQLKVLDIQLLNPRVLQRRSFLQDIGSRQGAEGADSDPAATPQDKGKQAVANNNETEDLKKQIEVLKTTCVAHERVIEGLRQQGGMDVPFICCLQWANTSSSAGTLGQYEFIGNDFGPIRVYWHPLWATMGLPYRQRLWADMRPSVVTLGQYEAIGSSLGPIRAYWHPLWTTMGLPAETLGPYEVISSDFGLI
ncbi:hypothetical protein EDB84DRAFT_1436152 [Lactarius hengduanensis]|nr:hypothetical protein EDB84DRAFT_1436152 [Lactarius hengduanensis]